MPIISLLTKKFTNFFQNPSLEFFVKLCYNYGVEVLPRERCSLNISAAVRYVQTICFAHSSLYYDSVGSARAATSREEDFRMKRVKAGCVLQTLVFLQKEDCGYSRESQLKYNREEVERYKSDLGKNKTRYRIVSVEEQEDASIIVRVRKHLNDKTDVSEYFA